jgi:hypothetical protein
VRDTATGKWYEKIVDQVLQECGLEYKRQQVVGGTPAGKQHRIDYLAWDQRDPKRKVLISCKVQNVGGTAEEKLPYEIIKLLHAMDSNPEYVAAYLVVGGTGWTREYLDWIRSGLRRYVPASPRIHILTTDELISKRVTV